MTRWKWNLRLSAALVLALVIGCGYWVLAGGCATEEGGAGDVAETEEPGGEEGTEEPGGEGGDGTDTDEPDGVEDLENLTVSGSTCVPLDDQAGGFEIEVEGVSNEGKQLSYARRFIATLDSEGYQVETEVMADGELVFTMLTSTGATSVQTSIEYGPAVSGAESASAMLEDGIITGSVDGRSFVPVAADDLDAENVALEDGEAAPQLDMDSDLEAALVDLFAAAENAANDCETQTTDTDGPTAQASSIPEQDTGHNSNPVDSAGCLACRGACINAGIGCGIGVGVGCASLFWCPPCLVACEIAAEGACLATFVSCMALCNIVGAPCCPVACGDVRCCDGGEECLNAATGLCCGVGKDPCVGKACCSETQYCIDTGPNAGTCCPALDVCGNTCCLPTEDCIPEVSLCCPAGQATCTTLCCPEGEECLSDGLCCLPGNICGSACCDELDDCIATLSLCCGFNEPACNDRCCDPGESCIGGDECCPSNLVCGSGIGTFCCPAGMYCDSDTDTCVGCPNPTDTPCAVGGCCPPGKFCQDVEGFCCDAGYMCCDSITCSGGCQLLSECIK